jgi:ADP-ribose pyrophosphatase
MAGENRKGLIENEYPEMPRPAVAAIVISPDRRVLMVKRGKPPAQDMWSVPGGSIELGETVFESAKREVLEETGIICNPKRVCNVIDAIYRDESGTIRFHYVIVYVVAEFLHGRIKAQDDAIEALASYAYHVNQSTQNIGARRLHTILERLLEQLSFEAPDMKMGRVEINAAFVRERLDEVAQDEDLSKFIL